MGIHDHGIPTSAGRHAPAGELCFVPAARMSSLTPVVMKPEDLSRPEVTTMVLLSHTRAGRDSATLPEVETKPKVVVPEEIHVPEASGEMLSHTTIVVY